jgi:hypothetical protein
MQKKTAATMATLALIMAIAATGVAAATIASPNAADTGTAGTGSRSGTTSTVVQTTAATNDDGWPGQLPDADRFHDLSRDDQQAVFRRIDRLIGDLRGTDDNAGLVAQLDGYRSEIERLLR